MPDKTLEELKAEMEAALDASIAARATCLKAFDAHAACLKTFDAYYKAREVNEAPKLREEVERPRRAHRDFGPCATHCRRRQERGHPCGCDAGVARAALRAQEKTDD